MIKWLKQLFCKHRIKQKGEFIDVEFMNPFVHYVDKERLQLVTVCNVCGKEINREKLTREQMEYIRFTQEVVMFGDTELKVCEFDGLKKMVGA